MSRTLASTQEIIEEIAAGRMVILVDDENRENEGDLIIAADKATPEAINFMARFGRGLICLCLTKERTRELGLTQMVRNNGTRHGTAFTQSIDAAELDSAPVSAPARAKTVAVAIDPAKGAEAIRTPGHIFPLTARDGGVLVRTGHTEAAVDLSKLAGLNPSSVICEVMNPDGTMARLDDLYEFAEVHGLKLGTIRDLILYRRRHDKLMELLVEESVETENTGIWTARTYRNRLDDARVIALIKGKVSADKPTLVRIHVPEPFSDLLDVAGPRHGLVPLAMERIAEAGNGVLVLVSESSINGVLASIKTSDTGGEAPGRSDALRDYGMGAEVLADIGVHDIRLLTNTHVEPVGIEAYGLEIVEEVALRKA